jgi:FkbM family methyltransferase
VTVSTAQPVFVSYSANREDVILNRVFGSRNSGFYIDVGAGHPLYANDTKALYDRGWRGINIEPSAEFFRELAEQRPLDRNMNVAVCEMPGRSTFYQVAGTCHSTCDAEAAKRIAAKGFEVVPHDIEAMTLRGILEAMPIPPIDLLKVAAEGLEPQVLASNNWARFRPKVILAEATFPETPVRRPNGVSQYLAAQGYRQVYFDGLNDYYVEQDFETSPEMFDRPPNVFDHFETYSQHEVTAQRNALSEQVRSLSQERDNALAFIASLQAQARRAMRQAEALAIDNENARAELVSMRERCAALAARREAVEQEADRLLSPFVQRDCDHAASTEQINASVARLANELRQVYASTSWRLTRPLRALARPGRNLRRLMRRPLR